MTPAPLAARVLSLIDQWRKEALGPLGYSCVLNVCATELEAVLAIERTNVARNANRLSDNDEKTEQIGRTNLEVCSNGPEAQRSCQQAQITRLEAALAAALAPPNDLTVEEVAALQQGLADVQAGRITPLAQIDAEREPVATASSQTTWTVAAADVETTNYKRIDESLKPAAALAPNSEDKA